MRNRQIVAIRVAPAVVFLSVVSFAVQTASLAEQPTKDSPNIIGVWKRHGFIDDDGEIHEIKSDVIALKIVASGHFCVTFTNPETGFIRHHGGRYTLEKDVYTEKIEFVDETSSVAINQTYKFNVEVKGDSFTQKGIGNPYNEVWKRVKRVNE